MSRRTSLLYRLARYSSDADAVSRSIRTGSPRPVERRLVNRAIGRSLARAGFWGALWGRGRR